MRQGCQLFQNIHAMTFQDFLTYAIAMNLHFYIFFMLQPSCVPLIQHTLTQTDFHVMFLIILVLGAK